MPAVQELIQRAVLEGDNTAAEQLAQQGLREGVSAQELLGNFLSGIEEVGRLWEAGEYFLPELVAAAEAVTTALKVLKPALAAAGNTKRGDVAVIGTVEGDIHDIGKSLVASMLMARGIDVVDLGTDVTPKAFADAVEANSARLVGVSALLTTTMATQKLVIEELRIRGLRDKVVVLVGGAPVNDRWATEIGADGTASDAVSAAELACKLLAR